MSINELKIKVFIKTVWFCHRNPLDWKKGEKAIVSPPKTLKDYEARLEDNSVEKTIWYLAKKQF
ncbi:hypothetical protein [Haloflavibacter putidus]|uniref:hypothetical protein n=1 Tax=Haloflavibacter putidus TaxID=2576776 RepID=UPI001F422954